MALNIRSAEADRLAGEVAALCGETKTTAVIRSLQERLNEIALLTASRPVIDSRSPEEILGYNAMGLPG